MPNPYHIINPILFIMKKIILITSVLSFSFLSIQAQSEMDALRFSSFQTGGTTRSLSMGGAFGAVGGDFSSLAINPAGLGIYRKGEFAFTADFNTNKSQSSFLNASTPDRGYRMGLSHFGFVVPINMNRQSSGMSGLTFAVGYNKLKDYGQDITMKGINNSSSLVDEFVYSANTVSDWDPYSDYNMAWETWLIDTLANSNPLTYYSDFTGSNYGQTQRRTVSTSGSLGEFDFSMAANLSDKLFLGVTMGVQKANYNEVWEHTETDPDDVINYFEAFTYRNELNTQGTGINFKLGLLAKPIEYIRLGASIQTPTVLKLNDYYQSLMATDLNDGQATHEYETTGEIDYTITTPLRATASAAFIYKQLGLVSIDYEFVDYTAASMNASKYDFSDENEAITERFRATSNLRIGAELHLASYYIRGGFSSYGDPYAEGDVNAGKDLVTWSGGLGYRDKNFYVDFGLAKSSWAQDYLVYYNTSAGVESTYTRFSTTIGFRF